MDLGLKGRPSGSLMRGFPKQGVPFDGPIKRILVRILGVYIRVP